MIYPAPELTWMIHCPSLPAGEIWDVAQHHRTRPGPREPHRRAHRCEAATYNTDGPDDHDDDGDDDDDDAAASDDDAAADVVVVVVVPS